MSVSHAERARDHHRWRRLVDAATHMAAFPDEPAFSLGQISREARGWLSPTEPKDEQTACLAFVDLCWAYVLCTTVAKRARPSEPLRLQAEIVRDLLAEPPERAPRRFVQGIDD